MAETKIMTLAAQQYYDEKIKAHIAEEDEKLVNGVIKTNADAIAAINNEETGILAQAKVFASEEDAKVQGAVDTLSGKVTTLVGDDANKSVRTIANEELAKQLVAEGAKESLDTLTEIAAWIQSHPDDASAMNKAISDLEVLVGALPDGVAATTVIGYVQEVVAANKALIDANTEVIGALHTVATTGSWNDLEDKPFYAEIVEATILPETVVNGGTEVSNYEPSGGKINYYRYTLESRPNLVVGNEYNIVFDDASYNIVCKEDSFGIPYLGDDNYGYYCLPAPNGVPFVISGDSLHTLSDGEHTVEIKGDVETVKTLDGKYISGVVKKVNGIIPDESGNAIIKYRYADLLGKPTLFSGNYADLTGKPNLFSGSWNDLTDKPFYENKTETIYIEKTEIPAGEASYSFIGPVTIEKLPYTSLPVIFDGSMYDCQRTIDVSEMSGWAMVAYGNVSLLPTNDYLYNSENNTGEPFCVRMSGSWGYYETVTFTVYMSDTSVVHTIESKIIDAEELVTLDEKFIPDTIARVSDFCEVANEEIDAMFA